MSHVTRKPIFGACDLVMVRTCVLSYSDLLEALIIYLLQSSADGVCKQIGPRPGPTKSRAGSGSKLFDTLMASLKEVWEKLILKNIII